MTSRSHELAYTNPCPKHVYLQERHGNWLRRVNKRVITQAATGGIWQQTMVADSDIKLADLE
jgi:hypothetical protein